jgi:hypothetical protein
LGSSRKCPQSPPVFKKTPLFEPFIFTNEHFTKTGSGHTHRENSKKDSFLKLSEVCPEPVSVK